MDSVDIEVLRTAEEWRKKGHRAALGTIVKTWGSAPRPVGAMVAIRDDGQITGSVSGGCVEDDLVEKVKEKFARASKPEVVTYGVTNEEATRWGLPCGGTLQLVVEPLSDKSGIAELLQKIGEQQLVRRRLEMDSGRATLEPGRWQDVLEFDLSADEIARLRGPVGLYIGSKTPPEIAVAILAEMTAVLHGVAEPSWAAKRERRFDASACEVKQPT